MRILVDQSGYDLLNIGDVAMLQSCVVRLRAQWPRAEIMVIAREPRRLSACCPDVTAVSRTPAPIRLLPRKPRLMAEQAWRMAGPAAANRARRRAGHEPAGAGGPLTAVQAVRAADVVVASGGGYLTDTWWWHAAGVLSLLSLAQRLGKPTAMFGQGIGPVTRRTLLAQARAVLPDLTVIGLRENRTGPDLVASLGVPPSAVAVTGDDALELIGGTGPAGGGALGVNVRVRGYAGVAASTAGAVGEVVLAAAAALGAPVTGLPVSRSGADGDLDALRALLQGRAVLDDLASPRDLAAAAAGCRAIVTGSYHAAVFGLAQGVPAVCLTSSPYYDAKFGGLAALFPGACLVIPLDTPGWPGRLRAAISAAWHLPAPARVAAWEAAARLRDAGRDAYARFRAGVEAGAGREQRLEAR